MIDKTRVLAALITQLETELALLTKAALMARDEATNEESRAESKWDTRGQEAAYLAEGQAKIANELVEAISLIRDLDISPPPDSSGIRPGSLFGLAQPDGEFWGLMAPKAGGTDFNFEGKEYTVVTPASPLGREVLGKRVGETADILIRRRPHPCPILAVH